MPFDLYNAFGTFQRCIISIFVDFIKNYIDMFMDDFSMYGSYFNVWLNSLDKDFHRRVETNLILNYEEKKSFNG